MNAKLYPLIALGLAVVLAAGCTHNPPAGSGKTPGRHAQKPATKTPPVARSGQVFGDPQGPYSARYLTGDFAGYPELERFIDKMVAQHGFSRDYLYGLFSQAQRKQWTLNYLSREPKPHAKPSPGSWSRYRSQFLTEKHISTGASFWARHSAALKRAEARFGVSAAHIMGIMGVETVYGGNVGNHRIIDALTTLAMDYPRRAAYFTDELENFLVMAQTEGFDPSSKVGSYAGAMGLGQFMPSSFLKFAVDFNGDGQKDLWDPEDAIGSIANYFAGHGWRTGEPVVSRAMVDGGAASGLESGFDTHYSLDDLAAYGIHPANYFPADRVRLLRLSAAVGDEYWLGYENFYVITRYNHSTHYAMAVHQLAEAVKQRYRQAVAER
jgi:membrane-bound lytic murein transglycosylase B